MSDDDAWQLTPEQIEQWRDVDDSDLMQPTHPFTNCNVCGIRLRTDDEYEMGMCDRCAEE